MEAGGRPRGELRLAVVAAFQDAAHLGQALTWHDVAQRLHSTGLIHVQARSECAMVRLTVGNMLAAGELVASGVRKVPGSRRPMVLYALTARADQGDKAQELAAALRAWMA